MAALNDLPLELLLTIASHLCRHDVSALATASSSIWRRLKSTFDCGVLDAAATGVQYCCASAGSSCRPLRHHAIVLPGIYALQHIAVLCLSLYTDRSGTQYTLRA